MPKPNPVKHLCALLLCLVLAGLLAGCGGGDNAAAQGDAPAPASAEAPPAGSSQMVQDEKKEDLIMVEITMENGGVIKLELDSEAAPITVQNFVDLANDGFYDGLIFHRVVDGFMIQGGDPTGTGSGGPGHQIKGEFAINGWENPISHQRGVISMARSNDPDSAGSQFFITNGDATFLDGQYAAFGTVVEGMDVVDRIAAAEVRGESPKTPEVMATVRIVEG